MKSWMYRTIALDFNTGQLKGLLVCLPIPTHQFDLTPSNRLQTFLGRGILIDYAHWCTQQSPPIVYTNFSLHNIPIKTLLAILTQQNVAPKRGDILFIRMGVIPEWDSFTDSQKQQYASQGTPQHAGVEPSLDLLEWLWDSGISAVAGDAISWEVYPTQGEISCHEYLLGGWGMPIGKFVLILPFMLTSILLVLL